MSESNTAAVSDRSMRLVAGFGLLVMAVLAAWANFGVIEGNVVEGDTLASAGNIIANEGLFRAGILAFVVIGLLDVIVAWALNEVLRDRVPALSSLAAVLRYVYGGILIVASGFLVIAAHLATSASEVGAVELPTLQAWLDGFAYTWDIGLVLFACHLLVLGLAIEKSKIARVWVGLGWIVMIAGAGYLYDAIAVVMNWDIGFEFASILFVGEVVLLAWLIWTGFREKRA